MNTFMRIQKAGFICLALVLAVTLAMHQGIVTAQETVPPPAALETDSLLTVSDLVSSSTQLSERLSVLRKNLELGFVLSDFQKYLSETEAQVKALSARLEEMKARGTLGYEKLSEVKMETVEWARQLEERYVPLAKRIKEVEDWGSEWVRDEERLLAL